jgi:hypothetical protein
MPAAAATSVGQPHRRSGVDSTTRRRIASLASRPNAVSIQPGARMFTRTLGPTDRASDLLKLRTPPFTAEKS